MGQLGAQLGVSGGENENGEARMVLKRYDHLNMKTDLKKGSKVEDITKFGSG